MPVVTFVAFDEILDVGWHVAQLQIAAASQFLADIRGYVLRPSFCGVERDDAYWIAVLPGQEVLDDRLQVRGVTVGFPPDRSQAAEVVGDQVDVVVAAARHN